MENDTLGCGKDSREEDDKKWEDGGSLESFWRLVVREELKIDLWDPIADRTHLPFSSGSSGSR